MKKILNLDGIEFMCAFFFVVLVLALALGLFAFVAGGGILIADHFFALPEWLSAVGDFLL